MTQKIDDLLPASEEGLYPIRTVSEVTGVNAITLRAWERRYGLFKPQRTPKGHRLYSQQDILRVQQVLQLLEKGVAIGRVARALKNNSELEDLADLTMQGKVEKSTEGHVEQAEAPTTDQWKMYHEKLISQIHAYDLAQLERIHHEIFSLYPLEIISHSLIQPIMMELRAQAEQLQSLSGHYHFYWHFLQQRIGGLFLRSTLQNRGKKILLMGFGDAKADIELMLFGLPLLTHGYRLVLLGCDVPFDAIPMTLSRSNSDGLILYASANNNALANNDAPANNNTRANNELDNGMIMSIKAVADSLDMPIFLGGDNTQQQTDKLSKQGLIVLPEGSTEQIKTLDEHLAEKIVRKEKKKKRKKERK